MTGHTPFQTAGPFLSVGLSESVSSPPSTLQGAAIAIEGRLLDGAGEGVPDGVLEFWQPDVRAFGRVLTAEDGGFRLDTVRSKYISLIVLGRGILTIRYTRIYLDQSDDDPVVQLVPHARRSTLVARKIGDARYHFDVILQGANETVFFDV
jgi:protocatechuate 3,4-dioxygenase alpha subunit